MASAFCYQITEALSFCADSDHDGQHFLDDKFARCHYSNIAQFTSCMDNYSNGFKVKGLMINPDFQRY